MNKFIYIKLIVVTLFLITSCKKILEVDSPIDQYTDKTVYSNVSTAVYAMSGIYETLQGFDGPLNYFSSGFYGFLGDELDYQFPGGYYSDIYLNNSNSVNLTSVFWDGTYRNIIYRCNAIIEGVSESQAIVKDPRTILIGEAKFTRALMYFYLTNLYGDVPLIVGTDFKVNSNAARATKSKVNEQIVKDLLDAQKGLPDNYLEPDLATITSERVRPNKAAATALLARVYLFLGEWQKAEEESNKVINDGKYALVDLNEVFLKNSREAIWQMQPDPKRDGGSSQNTQQAEYFIPYHSDVANDIYTVPDASISPFLLNAFETGDLRRNLWIKSINTDNGSTIDIPFKYKVSKTTGNPGIQTEYTMVLRLAEQYLIRAEARAHQGNLSGAKEDLNVVRFRAGLGQTPANSETEILDAIDNERYVELFTEFGHRWLDLKRRGKINQRMSIVTPFKGGVWDPNMALLGIPYDEFKYNPALRGHQNPGYREFP